MSLNHQQTKLNSVNAAHSFIHSFIFSILVRAAVDLEPDRGTVGARRENSHIPSHQRQFREASSQPGQLKETDEQSSGSNLGPLRSEAATTPYV